MSDFIPPPPEDVKPVLKRADLEEQFPGAWHGSATDELRHWRNRALAAEAELAKLRGGR